MGKHHLIGVEYLQLLVPLRGVIDPEVDAFLAEKLRRYEHDRRDVRHTKELIGHVDIRANGSLAMVMRMYDLAVG